MISLYSFQSICFCSHRHFALTSHRLHPFTDGAIYKPTLILFFFKFLSNLVMKPCCCPGQGNVGNRHRKFDKNSHLGNFPLMPRLMHFLIVSYHSNICSGRNFTCEYLVVSPEPKFNAERRRLNHCVRNEHRGNFSTAFKNLPT